MFNKSRRKIVFAIVFSLLAMMAVTLATIYVSNRISITQRNEEMLRMFVERYSLQAGRSGSENSGAPYGDRDFDRDEKDRPPEPPDERPGKNEPDFRLSTFYSVAYSKDGGVIEINNGNSAVLSDESLVQTAAQILKSGKKRGNVGNMTYLIDERGEYTLVAMIDGTINDNNRKILINQMLIIGSVSMVVLFVISVFIARRIVRPMEENDKRQKRFISDAGHELKTPIAVISANSELLKRQIGENEWLSNIDYENEKMLELVKQLLALSHAESGDFPKEILDFSLLIQGEVLPFEALAYENGKEIESSVEPGIAVVGNAGQLKQLVSVLLDNALSHGTGKDISLSLARERHFAVLTVSNESEEINEDQLSHLFDRLYRADEARSDGAYHYGLGLSVAKAIASSHGGEIFAQYKDGRAIFTVTLPVKKQ